MNRDWRGGVDTPARREGRLGKFSPSPSRECARLFGILETGEQLAKYVETSVAPGRRVAGPRVSTGFGLGESRLILYLLERLARVGRVYRDDGS